MSRSTRTFRRRDALHVRSMHFGPNMTPMVDVVMVILVFFMASSAFIAPEWFLPSLLARSEDRAAAPDAPVARDPRTPDPYALARVQVRLTLVAGPDGATRITAPLLNLDAAGVAEAVAAMERFAAGVDRSEIEFAVRVAPDVPYTDVIRVHEAGGRLGVRTGLDTR
jgi:biopolymer transport protein ExbD